MLFCLRLLIGCVGVWQYFVVIQSIVDRVLFVLVCVLLVGDDCGVLFLRCVMLLVV